ncbi:MAG: ion transporter [Sedimenticola sp.]|nr:ion transporter [Sedimenticola sp.]
MIKIKQRIWEIVEPAKTGDHFSHYFDIGLMLLIILNVLAVILESVKSIEDQFGLYLTLFEVFSVMIFTLEYLARIWTCTTLERYAHPLFGRLRFSFRPLVIVDLLAILPFYLPFFGIDLRVVRAFRLFRIIRIFKLGRYSKAFQMLGNVLINKKEEMTITIVALFFLIIISASLMYHAENAAQPEQFSSIPATIWWSVVTLTTVGYGDVYPVTIFGKVIAGIISILGIGMVALPAGIISAGFVEEMSKRK